MHRIARWSDRRAGPGRRVDGEQLSRKGGPVEGVAVGVKGEALNHPKTQRTDRGGGPGYLPDLANPPVFPFRNNKYPQALIASS